jgi:hypothetical protein
MMQEGEKMNAPASWVAALPPGLAVTCNESQLQYSVAILALGSRTRAQTDPWQVRNKGLDLSGRNLLS